MAKQIKKARGGKRPGAGRKSAVASGEIKVKKMVRLYPSQLKNIEDKFGSVQKLLDKYIVKPKDISSPK